MCTKKWAHNLSAPKLGRKKYASGYVYVIRTQKRTMPQNGSKKKCTKKWTQKNGHTI